ncbi:Pectinesterase inhibitor domain [Dillenia turbinata]|uniref:Pectinesterase n=1 Tax=Dillenia turbinata TaxID=194707 RepID=A0AAN8YWH9_9MAGN
MALTNFFLIFCLLPSLEALVYGGNSVEEHNTIQSMIFGACTNIEDQPSCLSNLDAELGKMASRDHNSVLSAAIQATLDKAREAIDMMTKFNTYSTSFREQIAIEDCKELLDFSVSRAGLVKIRAGDNNIHYGGNLKAWLSAALSNQDTCLEGFEGTDRRMEGFIRGSLTQVTQLIANVLSMYSELHSLPFKPSRNNTKTIGNSDFPKWITDGDKETLHAHRKGLHVDAVVALDGSGHHRSIAEAVYAAPSYSNRRYIIYIKKGIYKENIDLKKKKDQHHVHWRWDWSYYCDWQSESHARLDHISNSYCW